MSAFLSLPFMEVNPPLNCFKRQFWERDHALSQVKFYAWFQSCFYFNFRTQEFLRQLRLCRPESEFILSGAEHLLRQASSRILVRTSLQRQPKALPLSASLREQWCRDLSAERITLCHYRSITAPFCGQKECSKIAKQLDALARTKAMKPHQKLLLRWSQELEEAGAAKTTETTVYFLHEVIEKGNSSDLLTHLELVSESQKKPRTKTYVVFLSLVLENITRYLKFCSRKWNAGRGRVFMNLDWKFLNFIVDIRHGGEQRVRLTDIFPGGAHCYPLECFQQEFKTQIARCEHSLVLCTRLSATFLLVSVLTSSHEIDRYHEEHSRHHACDESCTGKHPECIMLCLVEALFVCLTQLASRCGETVPVFLQSLLDVMLICVVEKPRLRGTPTGNRGPSPAAAAAPRKTTDLLETLYHYGVKRVFNSRVSLKRLFADIEKTELRGQDPASLRAQKKRWLALLCLQLLRCPSCRNFPSWVSLFFRDSDLQQPCQLMIRCDAPRHASSRETKTRKRKNRRARFISVQGIKKNRTKHGVPTAQHGAGAGETHRPEPQKTCLRGWEPSVRETGMLSALSRSLPTHTASLAAGPVQATAGNGKQRRAKHARRGASAPPSCG